MNFLPQLDNSILIPAVVGMGATSLIILVGFITGRRTSSAESRLELFARKGSGRTSAGSSQSIEIWKEAAFEGDKQSLMDKIFPQIPTLQKLFEQADVSIKPSALLMLSLVLAVIGTVGSFAVTGTMAISIIPGILLFLVPWWWVFNQRAKRMKAFQTQMPDAMELLARALRAGQSLQAGLHIISEEMPPPIAVEFGRVYEEQNLGVSMEDAMKGMCDRIPNLDLRFFVTSVLIQRQTGGDLAEILDKIGYVIRERFKIMGMVQALTGEGRLSGTVLLALPFVMFLVVCHLNYDYARVLWETPQGRTMCTYALGMQLIGAYFIRKIVNIKV